MCGKRALWVMAGRSDVGGILKVGCGVVARLDLGTGCRMWASSDKVKRGRVRQTYQARPGEGYPNCLFLLHHRYLFLSLSVPLLPISKLSLENPA